MKYFILCLVMFVGCVESSDTKMELDVEVEAAETMEAEVADMLDTWSERLDEEGIEVEVEVETVEDEAVGGE